MPLLNIVPPEKAEGKVKDAYSIFEKMGMPVPLPLQMISVSPEILAIQMKVMMNYFKHPTLTLPLLAHIRLLVATGENYPFCMNFNRELLRGFVGLTDEQIDAAIKDPKSAALQEKDRELLAYVVKVVADPALSDKKDIERLRELGWSDGDIFDAVNHGIGMVTAGMAFKIFKMGE
ncbi:MAG: hypothetical protein HZB23_01655 [Deltaproteobacteria bacterium]|nr:hypothetical protein [Deltaproteobacteria bacterium]